MAAACRRQAAGDKDLTSGRRADVGRECRRAAPVDDSGVSGRADNPGVVDVALGCGRRTAWVTLRAVTAKPPLLRVSKLPAQAIWREVQHLNPWLAGEEGRQALAEVLPPRWHLVEAAHQQVAGDLFVDVLGTNASGEKVVAEAQLGASNHDHLGKLVTYAAIYQAGAAERDLLQSVLQVARHEFRDEPDVLRRMLSRVERLPASGETADLAGVRATEMTPFCATGCGRVPPALTGI